MTNFFIGIGAIVIAYLIGSISSAIITCKLMRLADPRESGSGNPGATNVLRVGGKKAAIITLIGDGLKGFIPVKAAFLLHLDPSIAALVAIAAFLGHLYPVFFGFKGGKGVATCLGVLFAIHLMLAVIIVSMWILLFVIFRYSSLAALSALAIGLVYAWHDISTAYYVAYAFMTIILFIKHRSNILRLMKGEESKFTKR
jgi:acyl phosphate:glycerol-3-phosphate acyltransferase